MNAELHKNPASSIHGLKANLDEIWYSIDNEIVRKCCMSMPKRLAQIVAAKAATLSTTLPSLVFYFD